VSSVIDFPQYPLLRSSERVRSRAGYGRGGPDVHGIAEHHSSMITALLQSSIRGLAAPVRTI